MDKTKRAMRAAILMEIFRETLELPDEMITWQQLSTEFAKLMEETQPPKERTKVKITNKKNKQVNKSK